MPGPAFGLQTPRELLAERIDQRVDQMFTSGLVQEVERLIPEGLKDNLTASQALGYRQVLEHLEGRRSLPETIALVKQKTRLYAKRQMTWFRHQAQLTWVELHHPEEPRRIAQQLAALWRVAPRPAQDILSGQQHLFESTHLDSE